jgi:hypothetical protein
VLEVGRELGLGDADAPAEPYAREVGHESIGVALAYAERERDLARGEVALDHGNHQTMPVELPIAVESSPKASPYPSPRAARPARPLDQPDLLEHAQLPVGRRVLIAPKVSQCAPDPVVVTHDLLRSSGSTSTPIRI